VDLAERASPFPGSCVLCSCVHLLYLQPLLKCVLFHFVGASYKYTRSTLPGSKVSVAVTQPSYPFTIEGPVMGSAHVSLSSLRTPYAVRWWVQYCRVIGCKWSTAQNGSYTSQSLPHLALPENSKFPHVSAAPLPLPLPGLYLFGHGDVLRPVRVGNCYRKQNAKIPKSQFKYQRQPKISQAPKTNN
jgi:hypothetical protein